MALPKQVQAQLTEVEELEKALTARADADTGAEAADTEADAAGTPEKVKPADTSPTDVADDFEQKYRTLRGKYDAEVPRLHRQVKELTDRVEALTRATQEAPRSTEPTKPKEKVSYVTDADRAEFGEELIDVQRRVAREVAEEYQEQLAAQAEVIRKLEAQVANTGNRLGEMSFAQQLNALVPDFAQIDRDERWVAWLNEYDPILRGPRKVPAQAAFNAGDADAVAHYVKLWKESISAPTEPARDPRQVELEKQVAPNRSANSVRTQSAGKDTRVYSPREVEAAWNKIRVLNTRGQTAEAAKLEADITAAYLEGRVRL
jgi:hypothetical protein